MSERLVGLLDDILEGRTLNAGLFCGYCYHPLPSPRQSAGEGPPTGLRASACPHCGRSAVAWPPVDRVPEEVLAMFQAQRSREGWVVRGTAWGGLTLGVVGGLLPLAFYGVSWWTVMAFFGTMLLFYIGSANLANSIGDAVGYRWGQSELRRRWEAFARTREGG